jgi:hypothetical protein
MKCRFDRRVMVMLAGLLISLISPVGLLAQKTTPPFPRDGATKVQDNNRVLTWDSKLAKGQSTGTNKFDMDQVSVSLTECAVKLTRPDGAWYIEQERLGSVRYDLKGTVLQEECISDTPCRVMVFQLKDYVPDPWPTREGIPGQFPRVNTTKLFETDRITVWDQVWKLGEPIARHAHYHRTVGVFLQGGTLHAIPDSGVPEPPFTRSVGEVLAGVTFKPDAHSEEMLSGSPRAIWIEFTK